MIEVLVVVAIMGLFALVMVMVLPRRREVARMASCQRNLMQIGVALTLYDQNQRSLPFISELGNEKGAEPDGPLKLLLEGLGLADFTELTDPRNLVPAKTGLKLTERRVPGFVCASDPHAIAGLLATPVSYRATTGDAPEGRNGAFAPGRLISLAQIEAADGLDYTAAYAERLVGDGQPQHPAPVNYALIASPLSEKGCPEAAADSWRGDAGSSWWTSNWQSTLYNHALTPNADPSCIASDRRSAFMGASSGHSAGVNVLCFDGSVRTCTPTIDPKIWREWARLPQAQGNGPQALPAESSAVEPPRGPPPPP